MSRDKWVPQSPQNLISRTTILILASLLIWVGAGRELPNNQNACYLLLGLVGIIGYLGLERAAFRRLQREHSNTQLLYRLEQRLHSQQDFCAEPLKDDADAIDRLTLPEPTLGSARRAATADRRAGPAPGVGTAQRT